MPLMRRWETSDQQLRFAQYLAAKASTAGLHGPDLYWVNARRAHVASGGVPTIGSVARLAGLLQCSREELVSLLPALPAPVWKNGATTDEGGAFWRALAAYLDGSGLSLAEFAGRMGVVPETLKRWAAGGSAYAENLRRVAAEVGDPALLDLIPSRAQTVTMRCRECGAEKVYQPHLARRLADASEERGDGRVTIALSGTEGEYECRTCLNRKSVWKPLRARLNKTKKKYRIRGDKEAFQKLGKELGGWSKRHMSKEQRSIRATEVASRRRTRSKQDLFKWRLSRLSFDPGGTLHLCRLCHRLMLVSPRNAARGGESGLFHAACRNEWQKKPAWQSWLEECRGPKSGDRPPMPVPDLPRGRRSSPDELLRMYRATLSYLWLREGCRGKARRSAGVSARNADELADHLGISRRNLYAQVQRFMELLPVGGVAVGKVNMWREVLGHFLTPETA